MVYGTLLAEYDRTLHCDSHQHDVKINGKHLNFTAPYESLSRTIREIGGDECAQTLENALDDFEYLSRANEWWHVWESLDLCNFVFSFYDEDMAMASRGLIQIIHHYLDVHQ